MKMAYKNSPIEEGTFQIQYFENIVYEKNYFEKFKNSFIKVLFIPNTKLSIQKVLEIIEPYKPTLQKEVEKIIKTNQNVYKYFDYQLSFNNLSTNSEMDLATRMEFIVNITMSIDLTLKED